jgi:hypothetical protein
MSVKIIAENRIDSEFFISATQQAGAYIGQPVPSANNTGSLTPVTSGSADGSIYALSYDGVVTVDNRLNAGGFESFPFDAGLCTAWTKYGASQTYAEETTIVHGGDSAQKITCVADGEPIGVSQSVSIGAAVPIYRAVAWVYCNENTTVTFECADLTGGSETFAVNATTWTECVWEVAPTGTAVSTFYISRAIGDSDVADYIIIDDAEFGPIYKDRFSDSSLLFEAIRRYYNGATVTFSSGSNDGESRTIETHGNAGSLQFDTAPDVTDYIRSGDTYTLSIELSELEFQIVLMSSGDIGSVGFKWAWEGTPTWLGALARSGSFYNVKTISVSTSSVAGGKLITGQDGSITIVYSNADDDLVYIRSEDNGKTWVAETTIENDDDFYLYDIMVLESGRIMALAGLGAGNGTDFFYSDDNGESWSDKIHTANDFKSFVQLLNGSVLAVNDDNNDIRCQVSQDGCLTWGDEVIIIQAANDQTSPTVCLNKDGNIVCAYETDADSAGDIEVKAKVSEDNGSTWGSEIDVIDFGSYDITDPDLVLMSSGKIYCTAITSTTGTDNVGIQVVSDDDGATWGDTEYPIASTADTLVAPKVSSVHGYKMMMVYLNTTVDMLFLATCFAYQEYSTSDNDISTAVNRIPQYLISDVWLSWLGKAGVVGDSWTFSPEWTYAMSNIVLNSRKKVWRSISDNAECNIILNAGSGERLVVDGVAFFDCNFWDMDFEMNASDSWGSPTLDQGVSFVIGTGTVDAASGNVITDSTFLASYKDHELKDKFFMPTSGTDSGVAFKILDNIGNHFILSPVSNSISTDNYRVFGTKVAVEFTEKILQYARLNISAQHTFDDYYQIGTMIAGKVITLSKAWAKGYSKTVQSGVEFIRPSAGGLIPLKRRENKTIFEVSWNGSEETEKEVDALFGFLEGKNLALIPDDSDLKDVYLCKIVGDLIKTHWYRNKWNFKITLEEI